MQWGSWAAEDVDALKSFFVVVILAWWVWGCRSVHAADALGRLDAAGVWDGLESGGGGGGRGAHEAYGEAAHSQHLALGSTSSWT